MSREIRVTVDRDRCVGSGNCEYWAPGVFEVGDDGTAAVVGDPSTSADLVAQAADACPTRAIAIQTDG